MATMSRGELAAELSRCEDLLRRWVLKAWVRGTETLKHAEIVESLEARLRDRACRVDGAFDDAGSTLALRRERDEYAAALTAAAAERDAAEARADAVRVADARVALAETERDEYEATIRALRDRVARANAAANAADADARSAKARARSVEGHTAALAKLNADLVQKCEALMRKSKRPRAPRDFDAY